MYRFLSLLAVAACAGDASVAQTDAEVRRIADEVIPRVEAAVGLEFKTRPTMATRSREQVTRYLVAKLDAELPPDTLERVVLAYRLFGLVPDTLDLRVLLLDLLAEQVVGYYDPDSTTLYIVEGTDPFFIRTVLAHELVHALQGQYMPLDSILHLQRQNDRRTAAQAVLEGQATLASLQAILSQERLEQLGDFWGDVRQSLRQEQEASMPAFSAAPLVIREELLFPYLAGAEFMRWFQSAFPDTVPYGPRLPVSTEQIIHPEKYRDADRPVTLRFVESVGAGAVVYEDTWGEFTTRIVLAELTGSESMGNAGARGWDGDRYAIFETDDGHALVWWSVWDSVQAAEKFARMVERSWPEKRVQPGRRWTLRRTTVEGVPAVVLVDAPVGWSGWETVPAVAVRPT